MANIHSSEEQLPDHVPGENVPDTAFIAQLANAFFQQPTFQAAAVAAQFQPPPELINKLPAHLPDNILALSTSFPTSPIAVPALSPSQLTTPAAPPSLSQVDFPPAHLQQSTSQLDFATIPANIAEYLSLTRPETGSAAAEAPFTADAATTTSQQLYFLDDISHSPSSYSPSFYSPSHIPSSPGGTVPISASSPVANAATPAPSTPSPPLSRGLFSAEAVKRDFPILQEKINGKPLIWLDNAATTQKPQAVIDRLSEFYARENSNIHRAAHTLAARATDAYEGARDKVRRFLNASSSKEIIFVRGTTEGINLLAQTYGRRNVREGDEIIISWLEHHANIVPWQMLCAETGAKLKVAPVDDSGQVILEEYEKLFTARTRLVSFTQVSNALGTVTPAKEMVAIARRYGAAVIVDGAQSVSHMQTDVQALDCDFFVFSGHKVFGPTGIGAVYGKSALLAHMPPWQGGGNMIADVTFEKTIYQAPPDRFEAGTGNIADAVGLGAAIDYVEKIGLATIAQYEHELLLYATEKLREVKGLKIIGTAKEKASVISFTLEGCTTQDVGRALNLDGIAVRAGHHCAQPILRRFGLESTVRPSLAFYNSYDEVDTLAQALHRIRSR